MPSIKGIKKGASSSTIRKEKLSVIKPSVKKPGKNGDRPVVNPPEKK